MEKKYLFNSNVLNDIKAIINDQLETWIILRPLAIDDYEKGILNVLKQLTYVGFVSRTDFQKRFNEMKRNGNYYIIVIEDTRSQTIIACATLFIEMKLIHECAIRGRVEDVVVSDSYRGRQLGKLIVTVVTKLAKKLGCYKISLECKDNLIEFYKSMGYRIEAGNSNSMVIRNDNSNDNSKL